MTWLDSSTLHQPQLSQITWVFSAASERDKPRYGTGREGSRPASGIIAEGIPGQFLFGVSRLVLALRAKNVSCHWCCTCRRVHCNAKSTPRYHCSLCHIPKTWWVSSKASRMSLRASRRFPENQHIGFGTHVFLILKRKNDSIVLFDIRIMLLSDGARISKTLH